MNVWDASDDALLAITRNVAIDRLRREAVRPSDPVDPMTMSIVDPATGPEDTALMRSDVERVAAALGALPEPQRRCVVLATVGGCTALEISESEHIPLGTAKTRIRDGLIRVRDALASEDRSRDDGLAHLDDGQMVALALGELTGRERADVLAHLVACRTCREDVDSLVAVADEILLLAPQAEPSAGFESAVLDRFESAPPDQPRARTSAGILAAVAAVVAIVVAGVITMAMLANREEGLALAEAPMVTPTGLEVGSAWSAGSDPGWILVSVPGWKVWDESAATPGEYWLQVELDDGSTAELGPVEFHDDTGSWAMTTSLATEDIRSVAVTDSTGRVGAPPPSMPDEPLAVDLDLRDDGRP